MKREYKLLIIISLLIVISILLNNLIWYRESINNSKDIVKNKILPLTSDIIYSEMKKELVKPIIISSIMANDVFFHNWIMDGEKDVDQIKNHLSLIKKRYNTKISFFISEKSKNYYYSKGILKKISKKNNRDNWYFKTKDSDKPYIVNIDYDSANDNNLTVFSDYKVIGKKGEFLGVAGVGISIDTFKNLITKYEKKYNSKIYLVNKSGAVKLCNDKNHEKVAFTDEHLKIITSNKNSSFKYKKNNVEISLNSRYITENGWYIIVEEHENYYIEKLKKTTMINILISSTITIMVLLMILLIIKNHNKEIKKLINRDKLSNAYNRQAFEEIYGTSLKKKKGLGLTIAFFDIDYFKDINDKYGHLAGDYIIKELSCLIKKNLPVDSYLFRWGGEEFLILFSNIDYKTAVNNICMLKKLISQNNFIWEDKVIKITVSGSIMKLKHDDDLDNIFSTVDKKLYEAKRTGRDKIIWDE